MDLHTDTKQILSNLNSLFMIGKTNTIIFRHLLLSIDLVACDIMLNLKFFKKVFTRKRKPNPQPRFFPLILKYAQDLPTNCKYFLLLI